ncbi:MAG: hypothetical protein PVG30_04110 [Gammaproteobacteria bacterium]|jgi:hypothetical protein
MDVITGIFSNLARKIRGASDTKSDYIFYKIVDSFEEDQTYKLQCINTKATFNSKITEIVFDIDILHGLHPVQACYIGIEYSRHIKNISPSAKLQEKQTKKICKLSVCRYGKYRLRFQDRDGEICFIDNNNNGKEFIMDPRDIALSEELINEFDAAQAFYIGLLAGFCINNITNQKSQNQHFQKPKLRIIK